MTPIAQGRLIEILRQLQEDIYAWEKKNFPKANSHQNFFGIVEEVGELAHFILKDEQGIRESIDKYGNKVPVEEHLKDAVGDVAIFLINYCSKNGFDFSSCLLDTWNRVSKRDWIKYPKDGVSE